MSKSFNTIGIDLGTTKTIVALPDRGIVLDEPSVIAVRTDTDEIFAMGEDALKLAGKTAGNLKVCFPLQNGVISDQTLCERMIIEYVSRATKKMLFKPQVAICIPSGVTGVESRAVVGAAITAGARKVYLVEEPVSAALGAGIDISRAKGVMVVDIGGGSTDIAVMSLGGIVVKNSIRLAGNALDESLVKYVLKKYRLHIGRSTAARAKVNGGSVYSPSNGVTCSVSGRSVLTALPEKRDLTGTDIYEALIPTALAIIRAIKEVLEKTPPELVGDIHDRGIILTGGGAMLSGLGELIFEQTHLKAIIPQDSRECVALGTAAVFNHLDTLRDGVEDASMFKH
jgi:Actin-like ATPase involved in cell morphogenesis